MVHFERMRRLIHLLPVALLLVCFDPDRAAADIYYRMGKDGVIHFTNRDRAGRGWKRIKKSGPGKASSVGAKKPPRRGARDRSPARFSRFDRHILEATTLYHIPVTLVRAVIHVESNYDPNVVSRAGAQGLMQLMPSISRGMGVRDPYNPRQNVFGGTLLLRILANRFDGDLVLTLAAYHAGTGAVRKYRGIPPYATTRAYIRMVLKQYYRYKKKAKKARDRARTQKAKAAADSAAKPTYSL